MKTLISATLEAWSLVAFANYWLADSIKEQMQL